MTDQEIALRIKPKTSIKNEELNIPVIKAQMCAFSEIIIEVMTVLKTGCYSTLSRSCLPVVSNLTNVRK
jgi:hypothetical protein